MEMWEGENCIETYTIEEPLIVVCPGHWREFHPFQQVGVIFASFDVAHFDFNPIRSRFAKPIGQQISIFREWKTLQRNCAVSRQRVWVQKYAWLIVQWTLFVHNTARQNRHSSVKDANKQFWFVLLLILESCVHVGKVKLSMAIRYGVFWIVPERR